LGSVPGKSFEGSTTPNGFAPPDEVQSVWVTFTGLKNANKGLDIVPVSMKRVDGFPATTHLSVDATCTKQTTSGKATPDEGTGKSTKAPDVTLSPVGGVSGDPVNVCVSPVVLEAEEINKAVITHVRTTDSAGNSYSAQIEEPGGSGQKQITFKSFPPYKTTASLPKDHKLKLEVDLVTGKPIQKTIQIGCTPATTPAKPLQPVRIFNNRSKTGS
jgi:hypothetical protein